MAAKTLTVTDGTRQIGALIERGEKIEAYSWPDEIYIAAFPLKQRREAIRAVHAADRATRGAKATGGAA